MSSTKPTPAPSSGWQTNVQGLRGIAIIGVILFHLWPSTFRAGYFGVDIFFVISGFLMCLLLDAKKPLGFAATLQFYFRRLKRILPTYLFVILLFLAAAFWAISPTDFAELRAEIRKPLLLIANVPDPAADYFAEAQGGFSFFVHLWSLSTELQFYACVPLLVFFLHRMHTCLQLVVILGISTASFYVQLISSKDYAHKALACRIWQFMAGFLAFHLQQFVGTKKKESIPYAPLPLLTATSNEKEEVVGLIERELDFRHEEGSERSSTGSRLLSLVHFLLPLVLILLLAFPLTAHRQLDRLVVIAVTSLTIGLSAQSILLTNGFLVAIGDISYSVYLVHWPLIEYHRYAFVEVDFYSRHASVFGTSMCGLLLIVLSVVGGQLVEDAFKRVGRWLNSWASLLLAILLLYAAIYGVLRELKANELDYAINFKSLPRNYEQIAADALRFQRSFDENPQPLNATQSLKYERGFAELAAQLWFCDKRVKRPPTNFNGQMGRLKDGDLHCTNTEGRGSKTIVIFGNSFGRCYMPGILEYFKDVYSNVTLLHRNGCMFVGGLPTQHQYGCVRERKALLPMLREWKYPIDVLVFAQAFNNKEPRLRITNMSTDPIYLEMQEFFDELSEIAREVVLFPQFQYETGVDAYMKIFNRKAALGHDLGIFRTPFKYVHTFHSATQRRIAAVECEKCAKLNWEDLWCDREAGVCNAVDRVRRLPFFYDVHHLNVYGSYFAGKFFRSGYDRWMAAHSTTTSTTTTTSVSRAFNGTSVDSNDLGNKTR